MLWIALLLLLRHQRLLVYCATGSFGRLERLLSDVSIRRAENSLSLL